MILKALSRFVRKWLQRRHPTICKKPENFSFQMLKTFVFDFNVTSKSFSKMLPATRFWFKQFWAFCLMFREDGCNSKIFKSWKMLFSNAPNIRFHLKVAWKPFSKILLMNDLWFKWSLRLCLTLPKKEFQLGHSKNFRQSEKYFF